MFTMRNGLQRRGCWRARRRACRCLTDSPDCGRCPFIWPMTLDDDTAARFRKRAEELRAEASESANPEMRDKLLKLARACEEMATGKMPKATES